MYENEREIKKIAETIFSILPNGSGVTLGGSRAINLNDSKSDVEMYFYSEASPPDIERLTKCLYSINAKHKRSPTFLWNEQPWGPHSFFEFNGLSFEVGYRNIDDVKNKIDYYLEGNVSPKEDCHDLGLGYMYSGLLASICSEKIIIAENNEIKNLQYMAHSFPDKLVQALKSEYLVNSKALLDGKLLNAAFRGDQFFYEVISTRIIRDLMIMAFSISKQHFPGDKWNEELLLRTNWSHSHKFLSLIKKHISLGSENSKILNKKRNILLNAYNLIEGEFN